MSVDKKIEPQEIGDFPQHNQTVKFIASMKVKDTNQTIFDTKYPQRAVIGQNQITSVIESTLLGMKKGQKSTLTLTSEQILSMPNLQLYKDKIVELSLQLVDIRETAPDDKYLSLDEKEKKASALKIEGNDLLKLKKYSESIHRYTKAYKLVEFNTTEAGLQLRNSLLLNLSLAFINNKQYEQALDYIQKILREDPFHLKALYRKASALRYLGHFDRATRQIKRVLEQNPDNKEFTALLQQIKEHEEANKKKEKQLYGKMFGN